MSENKDHVDEMTDPEASEQEPIYRASHEYAEVLKVPEFQKVFPYLTAQRNLKDYWAVRNFLRETRAVLSLKGSVKAEELRSFAELIDTLKGRTSSWKRESDNRYLRVESDDHGLIVYLYRTIPSMIELERQAKAEALRS